MITKILIVSASLSAKSKSRELARYAASKLGQNSTIQVEFEDLTQCDLPIYPRGEGSQLVNRLQASFESSDAMVLAAGIHNWRVDSSMANYLEYVLDPEGGRRHRPFVVLAAAGSTRSHLACDGLVRTITTEISGIQIGAPIVAGGEEIKGETSELSQALHQRINCALALLVHHTRAAREFVAMEHTLNH